MGEEALQDLIKDKQYMGRSLNTKPPEQTKTTNHLTTLGYFYRCSVHSEIYIVHSATNSLFIKIGKV